MKVSVDGSVGGVASMVTGPEDFLVGVDSETLPFQPGNAAPPSVCWAFSDGQQDLLMNPAAGLEYLQDLLKEEAAHLALHFGAYDLTVAANEKEGLLPWVFHAYDSARVHDTGLSTKLIDLADGEMGFRHHSYSLAEVAKSHLGIELEKGAESWRMNFPSLRGLPIASWPAGAREYALADSRATLHVRRAQAFQHMGVLPGGNAAQGVLVNEDEQTRADFALHLSSVHGLRTDGQRIQEIETESTRTMLAVLQSLSGTGLLRGGGISTNALRDRVEKAYRALGKEAPRTDPSITHPEGQVQYSVEALKGAGALVGGDPLLDQVALYYEHDRAVSTYLPSLRQGVDRPINVRINSLLKTGRTSNSNPTFGNFPRKGPLRSCVVPRPGTVLASVDYGTIELVTLAQDLYELFGPNCEMVKALIAENDLHVDLAALMLGLDYQTAMAWYSHRGTTEQYKLVKEKRQFCKPPNFGISGGMGELGLQEYAVGMGTAMTMAECKAAIAFYNRRWPEMPQKYFPFIKRLCGDRGYGSFVHPISGRKYGKGTFTEISNARFQGRAADGAKRSLYEVTYRAYCKRDSWLYGSRVILFAHDELIMEVPEQAAHEAAWECAEVMEEGMRHYVPNIPFKAKPALMRRWLKEAEEVTDPNSKKDAKGRFRLVPYEPAEKRAA